MADGTKFNLRNPAVKRIVQELRELQRDDNPDVVAEANEDNIFEWHFAIRGAWDTEFEGGIYHGRIIMPAEYPFKPPAFVMLTPSGRFETNVKICLSISSHHPESWQPSWSVRSALIALIAFMQSPGHGALGSLDQPKDVRQQLAAASRDKPPTYGNEARQQVIRDMHQRMLDMEARSRKQHHPDPDPPATPAAQPGEQQQQQQGEVPGSAEAAQERGAAGLATSPETQQAQQAQQEGEEGLRRRCAAAAAAAAPPAPQLGTPAAPVRAQQAQQAQQQWAAMPPPSLEDRLLTWLAILLVLGILALVARRLFAGVLVGDASMAGHAMPDSHQL